MRILAPKPPVPSLAQAKLIARLWATGDVVKVGGYNDATTLACLKRGWLVPNGEHGIFPNKSEYKTHVLSNTALDALEDFLSEGRRQRGLSK